MLGLNRAIVYNGFKGGVQVCHPSPQIFAIMSHGGWWDLAPHGFVEAQIERQISSGIDPDHAARFARAVAFGGVTEAETWDIVKDRDCARHGDMHEVQRLDELPDRWFRDAWSRSRNGGPIGVDLEKARPIQWRRLLDAVSQENKRREFDLFGPAPIRLRKLTYQNAIKHARDDEELRCIWPKSLPLPSLALRPTV